jgi:hypothetical protein
VSSSLQLSGVTRSEPQRHDLSVVGREVVNKEEVIDVLEVSLRYQFEQGSSATISVADICFVAAEAIHSVENVRGGFAAELAACFVESGKLRMTVIE